MHGAGSRAKRASAGAAPPSRRRSRSSSRGEGSGPARGGRGEEEGSAAPCRVQNHTARLFEAGRHNDPKHESGRIQSVLCFLPKSWLLKREAHCAR